MCSLARRSAASTCRYADCVARARGVRGRGKQLNPLISRSTQQAPTGNRRLVHLLLSRGHTQTIAWAPGVS
jgi:hypothetical protein